MAKHLYLICLLISIQSCKTKSFESFSEFPSQENLTHQLIEVEGLADPDGVLLLDDAVIIHDLKSDYFIHVLNRVDYSSVGSFARKGHGPSEEMMILNVRKIAENQFVYNTLSHLKIFNYNPVSPGFELRQSMPVIFHDLMEAFILNDTVYGWNREVRENEFIEYHGSEQMLDFGADFPLSEKRYTNEEQARLFSAKQVTVKPDGKHFAATYLYLPVLRIFDTTDGSVLKEVRFENDKPFPHYQLTGNEADWEHVTQNYWYIKSSDNFIYAQYRGKTFGESGYDRNSPGNAAVDVSNEIHVYDWAGNPIRRIITDKTLFNFDVSADDRIIIGISKNDPDHLYEYKL